jgi:hypothetical protein
MSEQSKSFLDGWWEMQEKVFGAWKDSMGYLRPDKMTELYEKQLEFLKATAWPGGDPTRFYQDWLKQSAESMQEMVRWAPGGVGGETMDKLLRATEVYTKLLTFWQEFAAGMPGKSESQKWQRFAETMLDSYNSVMDAFFAVNLPDAVKVLIRSPLEIGEMYRKALTNLLEPWLESSEVLQEKYTKVLQGDRQAYMDFTRAWYEASQESAGKFLRMPALGLSKDNVEKILGSLDSFNKLVSSVFTFSATMYRVGYEVMRKLMQDMSELSQKGAAPESFKDFYKAWWQANEEAYFQLFKTESFSKILGEVVDASVSFKKRYDDLLMDVIAGSLPVVTNRDMDSLAKAVYDLKKSQKAQAKKIEELTLAVESLKGKEVSE